ncbi:uroporphyrinogen-III C-methyltransferase [Zhihengliuella flava]|uniref:uroporphyrinogen-III C-methyltransferase n=1 Tax=Zhihengliuella flava TaxID=1285193 RepID=A0A931GLC9_9MICC|nr:uroporphyrinogen-III C-methyltransferase [Zhihengliuella flava]MBG6084334.1 uroporphyrin-III C-methyltransferase [Zhihengliuella flava]
MHGVAAFGSAHLRGHTVIVCGRAGAARRAVARYRSAGADVLTAVVPSELALLGPSLRRASLVVGVDDGDPGWDVLPAVAREQRTLLLTEEPAAEHGHVTLVGGGPGEADLLTVAGRRALAAADVVYYDRLGPGRVVADLAPGAELIDVGKTPGHHKVPQETIQAMMVESALAGHAVVRLKGGDPFVFGRGGEEVAACLAAEVPVTTIPGISSSVAVPGTVGIPVTHRGVSKMFTVASGHVPFSDDELEHLAGLGGTLVILMGVGTLAQTIAGLRRHGMDPATPAAVVERGYSAEQRSTVARLDKLALAAAEAKCASPAVIVIGDVVAVGNDWKHLTAEFGGAARSLEDVHA